MKFKAIIFISAAIFIPNLHSPAFAEPDKKNHNEPVRITPRHKKTDQDNNRELIVSYLQSIELRNCPHGFAKRNGGCLPAERSKQHQVGQELTKEDYKNLPGDLAQRLTKITGYKYVQLDGKVALISEDKQIIKEIFAYR